MYLLRTKQQIEAVGRKRVHSENMGSVASDITYNVKAQAGVLGGGALLYRYIGVAGDGELVRLMKEAIKKNNYNEVDRVVRTQVVKFLLNDGKGENVRLNKSCTNSFVDFLPFYLDE